MVDGLSLSKLSIRPSDSGGGFEITPAIKDILNQATNSLDGPRRRLFMAKTVDLLGKGGQRKVERELGWD